MSNIPERNAEAIRFGDITLYCESLKASGTVNYYEQPTVTGDTAITNRCRRYSHLTFSGRYYGGDNPLGFLPPINNMLVSRAPFSISYRGLKFSGCLIQGYTAEENDGGWVTLTITVITADYIFSEDSQ